MAFEDKFRTDVKALVETNFLSRDGTVVPEAEKVYMHQSVKVDATYLFADLAGSSEAAQSLNPPVAATVIRSFLNAASTIIQHNGGEIRSYDGDRVMGIFMGGRKNTDAICAGLGINWAVKDVVRPALREHWSDLENHYTMSHAVGIATGQALIVKAGVWGNNDLISIGAAPNVAAKLSDIRSYYSTYITNDVYDECLPEAKMCGNTNMWKRIATQKIGGNFFSVLGSSYQWTQA